MGFALWGETGASGSAQILRDYSEARAQAARLWVRWSPP
jgi:hypothetical protein